MRINPFQSLLIASVVGLGFAGSGSSALAAACTIAPVSTYTATGFSCSVGPVTFSNISVTPTTTGSGVVGLTQFQPFTFGGDYGLELIYSATTGSMGGTADVAWTYDVSGKPPLDDAWASLTGGTTGTSGTAALSETLSNGTTLSLGGPGATPVTTFAPIATLRATKDQQDFASAGSTAFSSVTANAFSVVPEPSTWAMLLLGFAGLAFLGYRRTQRTTRLTA